MIIEENPKFDTKVRCICDNCGKEFEGWYNNIIKSRKRRNSEKDYCKSCSCKLSMSKKPQCQKWTEEMKQKHKDYLNSLDSYKNRKKVHLCGKLNGMFGKHHTAEARQKMSEKRKDKFGEKAPAWKGGKQSLVKRVKSYLHRTINWYKKVYIKYNFKCAICGSSKNLDAHHIVPISTMVKNHLQDKQWKNEDEKLLYLIQQEDIVDKDLQNGVCLCRSCHKKIHINWGSHYPNIQNIGNNNETNKNGQSGT